jgi:hypothetical protein
MMLLSLMILQSGQFRHNISPVSQCALAACHGANMQAHDVARKTDVLRQLALMVLLCGGAEHKMNMSDEPQCTCIMHLYAQDSTT